MKIGILSDTHDRLRLIHQAVDVFNRARVELVLHAGDYVAPFALDPFAKLKCGWRGVLGNNDGEEAGLLKLSSGRISGRRNEEMIAGRRILMGHDETILRKEGTTGAEVVICGHTHEVKVVREGSCLWMNPGECCGYLKNRATVALLDAGTLEVEIIELVV